MLDPELRSDVELFYNATSGLLYSSNIDRKRDIESQLRSIAVTQFAQQDISKVVAKFLNYCEELDDMDSYNHDNTVKILDCMTHAGGGSDPKDPDTLEWRSDVLVLCRQLKEAMVKIRRLSLSDQDKYLKHEGLHYRMILQTLNDNYCQAIHNKSWPPAKSQIDRRTPQLNLSEGAASDSQLLLAALKAFALQQTSGNKDQQNKGNQFRNRTRQQQQQNKDGERTKPNPKNIPPSQKHKPKETKDGVHHYEKKFGDDTFHWCATCSRWTKSHWTNEHRKPSANGGGTEDNLVEFYFSDFDFSQFDFRMVDVPVVEPVVDDHPTSVDWSVSLESLSESVDWSIPSESELESSVAPPPSLKSTIWSYLPSLRSVFNTTVVRPVTTAVSLFVPLLIGIPAYALFTATSGWLSASPVASAVTTFGLHLRSLFVAHWCSWNAAVLWTWLACLVLLAIGPDHLISPQPLPRQLRRQLARSKFRSGLPRIRSHHPPPYHHRAHQPIRSMLLSNSTEGESHRKIPSEPRKIHLPHLQLNFRHPRIIRHGSPNPSCRQSRSKVDLLLRRIRLQQAYMRHFRHCSQAADRKEFMQAKAEAEVIKQVRKWKMEKANRKYFDEILPEIQSVHTGTDDTSVDSTESENNEHNAAGFIPSVVHLFTSTIAIGATFTEYIKDSLFIAESNESMIAAFKVIWDSGASICVSPFKEDFIGDISPPPDQMKNSNGDNSVIIPNVAESKSNT